VLTRLQDGLGRMNDVVVAEYLLKRQSAAGQDQKISDSLSTTAATISRWYSGGAISSEYGAEANGREFRRCKTFW
jgi:hypothetical protein